jgi:hypothetical protein
MSSKFIFAAVAGGVWLVVPIGCGNDGPISVATGGSGGSTVGAGGSASGGTGNAGAGGQVGRGSLDVRAGGYVLAAPWSGYAWTASSAAGSTIDPADYSAVVSATELCAKGSVAAMSDYSGTGMIGLNLNQAQDGTNPPVETWTPASITSGGIAVNVLNVGGSVIRVQLQAPGGATDGTKRWCAPISAFGQIATIPWSAFSTTCWNSSGTAYAGEPLESVIIIVPGGNQTAVSFDFCVEALALAA